MPELTIFGASARAAAQSAIRAGYRVAAADLFADGDLTEIAQVIRIAPADYPHAFKSIAGHLAAAPWLYLGGLENYPRLVDQMGRQRRLLGNPGTILRRVRDPFQLSAAFASAGVSAPKTCQVPPAGMAAEEIWLQKPMRGSGGRRVSFVTSPDLGPRARVTGRRPGLPRGWFFQRYLDGPVHAAVFVAAAGEARLLGVTRQWVPRDVPSVAADLPPFAYLGSIGPLCVSEDHRVQWQIIGDLLAREFGLRGLFGVDAVVAAADGRETIWPLEVNPRYTASVEILERGSGCSAINTHVAACREGRLPDPVTLPGRTETRHGKVIVYADRNGRVTPRMLDVLKEWNRCGSDWPVVADLPCCGCRVRRGQPLLTCFAEGATAGEVARKLGLTASAGLRQRAIELVAGAV